MVLPQLTFILSPTSLTWSSKSDCLMLHSLPLRPSNGEPEPVLFCYVPEVPITGDLGAEPLPGREGE